VIYSIYLGLRQILVNSQSNSDNNHSLKSLKALCLQGFITSASNPKAIIFFAALFPQFVSPHAPSLQQFAVLGMTYLILDGCFLFLYGIFAEIVARRLKGKLSRGLHVASGGLIIGAAVLLGLRGIEIDMRNICDAEAVFSWLSVWVSYSNPTNSVAYPTILKGGNLSRPPRYPVIESWSMNFFSKVRIQTHPLHFS